MTNELVRAAGYLRGLADGLDASPRFPVDRERHCLVLSESMAKHVISQLRLIADLVDTPPTSSS